MIGFVKRLLGIRESTDNIFGTPVDFAELDMFRGQRLVPLWSQDPYPEKNSTLRTQEQHNLVRNTCAILYETNPNAAGLVDRVTDYAVGCGSSTEVASTEEGEEAPPRLKKQVEGILKPFKTVNGWRDLEDEIVLRLFIHGEFFLRFFADEDNVTKVRFIEPGMIVTPYGQSTEGDWSFGIYTPADDVASPREYNVRWHPYEEEQVDAEYILHGKINCRRNQKRGLPWFYACEDDLRGTAKLRHATREGEKVRQGIAFFRVHATAPESAIRALQDANASRQYTDRAGHQHTEQRQEPGAVVDIPKGLSPESPPASPNAASASSAVDMSLQAVAARTGFPVSWISGKADDSGFAAGVLSESPVSKKLERLQAKLADWVDQAQTKALQIAIYQDQLAEDALEKIDLKVTFPSPITRNRLEETQRRKILRDDRVISGSQWAKEEGYDAKEQRAQMVEEQGTDLPQLPAKVTQTVDAPSGTPGAQYAREVK